MKNLWYSVWLIVSTALASCSSGTFSNDSVDSARDLNDSALDARPSAHGMDLAATDFAVWAADANSLGLAMGTMAGQKAFSDRVRRFGQMLARDNTATGAALQQTARSQGIALPLGLGAQATKTMEKIATKNGERFDKAYMQWVARECKQEIAAFKTASKTCRDPVLRSFAARSLPLLQKQLDSALAMSDLSRESTGTSKAR